MNDELPTVTPAPPDPRPLTTPDELRAAIDDMQKLMDATGTLHEHHVREVYTRMPQYFCLGDAINTDLQNLRLMWFHTKHIRDQLIVHLFKMTQGGG
jgi:hypothetical protein